MDTQKTISQNTNTAAFKHYFTKDVLNGVEEGISERILGSLYQDLLTMIIFHL